MEEYLSYHYSTLTEGNGSESFGVADIFVGETIKIKQEDQIFELKVVEVLVVSYFTVNMCLTLFSEVQTSPLHLHSVYLV